MPKTSNPDRSLIGIFDSGIGGLSIWREIAALLPAERTIYIADHANFPYGQRPSGEITDIAAALAAQLIEAGCKMITVACNTATAAAIDTLREKFELPFVGLEPAVKPAVEQSRAGIVGILATQGTLASAKFSMTTNRYAQGTRLVMRAADDLVLLVEQGRSQTQDAHDAVLAHVNQMLDEGVDKLVLGCTHFSFLANHFHTIAAGKADIVDTANAVARRVAQLLSDHGLLANLASGDTNTAPTCYSDAMPTAAPTANAPQDAAARRYQFLTTGGKQHVASLRQQVPPQYWHQSFFGETATRSNCD